MKVELRKHNVAILYITPNISIKTHVVNNKYVYNPITNSLIPLKLLLNN